MEIPSSRRHDVLQDTLEEIASTFAAENALAPLEERCAALQASLALCRGRAMMRDANRLRARLADAQHDLARCQRKHVVYAALTSDVREALESACLARKQELHVGRRMVRRAAATTEPGALPPASAAQRADAAALAHVRDALLSFEDVVLVDDGQRVHDRTVDDDLCPNCQAIMTRHTVSSCLVCPNLDCQYVREYIDTQSFTNQTYTKRHDAPSHKDAAGNVSHYSSFLSTCQGKSGKNIDRVFLYKISYFCYVQGAREPEDITKKMINKAQKYFTNSNQYNISVLAKVKLRGDALRMPPDLVKKMHLLFRAVWPVFVQFKPILKDNRRNMTNFSFTSRVFVRLLGYDVFARYFDIFDMPSNQVRHYAFIRRLLRHLRWEWHEELSDVPDWQLDEFERKNGMEERWQELARCLPAAE